MNGIRRKRRWSTRQSGWDEIPDERSEHPTADQKIDRESLLLALDQVGGIEADLIRLKHFEGLTFAAIAAPASQGNPVLCFLPLRPPPVVSSRLP